jgi:hypothetical protein
VTSQHDVYSVGAHNPHLLVRLASERLHGPVLLSDTNVESLVYQSVLLQELEF